MLEGLLERAKKPERRAELEAELRVPPPPAALSYVIRIFWRLRRRKGSSGFGPLPIEWSDIDAFTRFSRLTLTPFEIEMIELLDDLFMAEKAKPDARDSGES